MINKNIHQQIQSIITKSFQKQKNKKSSFETRRPSGLYGVDSVNTAKHTQKQCIEEERYLITIIQFN